MNSVDLTQPVYWSSLCCLPKEIKLTASNQTSNIEYRLNWDDDRPVLGYFLNVLNFDRLYQSRSDWWSNLDDFNQELGTKAQWMTKKDNPWRLDGWLITYPIQSVVITKLLIWLDFKESELALITVCSNITFSQARSVLDLETNNWADLNLTGEYVIHSNANCDGATRNWVNYNDDYCYQSGTVKLDGESINWISSVPGPDWWGYEWRVEWQDIWGQSARQSWLEHLQLEGDVWYELTPNGLIIRSQTDITPLILDIRFITRLELYWLFNSNFISQSYIYWLPDINGRGTCVTNTNPNTSVPLLEQAFPSLGVGYNRCSPEDLANPNCCPPVEIRGGWSCGDWHLRWTPVSDGLVIKYYVAWGIKPSELEQWWKQQQEFVADFDFELTLGQQPFVELFLPPNVTNLTIVDPYLIRALAVSNRCGSREVKLDLYDWRGSEYELPQTKIIHPECQTAPPEIKCPINQKCCQIKKFDVFNLNDKEWLIRATIAPGSTAEQLMISTRASSVYGLASFWRSRLNNKITWTNEQVSIYYDIKVGVQRFETRLPILDSSNIADWQIQAKCPTEPSQILTWDYPRLNTTDNNIDITYTDLSSNTICTSCPQGPGPTFTTGNNASDSVPCSLGSGWQWGITNGVSGVWTVDINQPQPKRIRLSFQTTANSQVKLALVVNNLVWLATDSSLVGTIWNQPNTWLGLAQSQYEWLVNPNEFYRLYIEVTGNGQAVLTLNCS